MIIRTEKKQTRYSVVDNTGFEDDRLSLKAKGLLIYFLTKPDSWEVRIEDLVKRHPDGRDSIQAALKELGRNGYAELKTVRGGGGRIGGKQWIIHETPIAIISSPTNGKPVDRSNSLESRDLGIPSSPPTNGFSVGRKNRRTEKPSDGKTAHIVSTKKEVNTEEITSTEKVVSTECASGARAQNPTSGSANSGQTPVGQKTPPSSAAPPSLLFMDSAWACAPFEEWASSFEQSVSDVPGADPAWYLRRVRDWSAEKGGTSRDWISTAARFARDDQAKGKLVISSASPSIQNTHGSHQRTHQQQPRNASTVTDPATLVARTARVLEQMRKRSGG